MRTRLLAFALLAIGAGIAARLWLEHEPAATGEALSSARSSGAAGPLSDQASMAAGSAAELPGTIAGIVEMPHDFSQTYAAFALAAGADPSRLQALIEEAQRLPEAGDRVALSRILILRYAEIAPDQAARYVAQATLDAKPELLFTIFSAWSRVELEAATAAVADLASAQHRQVAAQGILAAATESDIGSVGDIVERLAALGVRDAVTPSLVARVAAQDPEAALGLAGTIEEQAAREATQASVIRAWAASDPGAAIRALERIAISNPMELMLAIGKAYARQAPAAALEWSAGTGDYFASMAVMAEVMRQDPVLMLEKLRADYTPVQQQTTVDQIMQMMTLDDPAAAVAVWGQLPAEFRPSAARTIVSIWAQRNPLQTEAWVLGLSQPAARQEALRALLIMLLSSPDEVRYARLHEQLVSAEDRDTYGYNRIATLVRGGDLIAAEQQLGRLNLSPDARRRARAAIDEASP